MSLLLLSFTAWVLTVLAPCVLPILPVILWWSTINWRSSSPFRIIAAFAISVIVFTLILKVLMNRWWIQHYEIISYAAWILIWFGLVLLFPAIWQWVMQKTWIEHIILQSQWLQEKTKNWVRSDILLWATLWPVLNSCSPTFALIIFTILPWSIWAWFFNILAYTLWLSLMLLLIARWWHTFTRKIARASNPHWWFRKLIALLIMFVWIAILFWRDKVVERQLAQREFMQSITRWEIERRLERQERQLE